MSLTRTQYALIEVATRASGLTDADDRSILVNLPGVRSPTDLERGGFDVLIGDFEYPGFTPMKANGKDYGRRLCCA